MFWWKNDSGGAVLGSSGGGQEISETKIMIGSSKLLIFEHHSVREIYTIILFDIYSQMVGEVF